MIDGWQESDGEAWSRGMRPINCSLDMVPKHELLRMRIQIDLVANVGDIKDLHIVFDQR